MKNDMNWLLELSQTFIFYSRNLSSAWICISWKEGCDRKSKFSHCHVLRRSLSALDFKDCSRLENFASYFIWSNYNNFHCSMVSSIQYTLSLKVFYYLPLNASVCCAKNKQKRPIMMSNKNVNKLVHNSKWLNQYDQNFGHFLTS